MRAAVGELLNHSGLNEDSVAVRYITISQGKTGIINQFAAFLAEVAPSAKQHGSIARRRHRHPHKIAAQMKR